MADTPMDLDDDDVDTVSGLMAKRLGVVPLAGTTVRIDGRVMTAESAVGRRHRISSILVEPLQSPDGDRADD